MAVITYSPGIDHVSGALAKPGKNGQHSCTKMLLATHRVAESANPNCNRIYLRTPMKRTTPLSQNEQKQQTKFGAVARAVNTRLKDLNQSAIDAVAFKNQSTYKTLRQYVWALEQERWEQDNE